MLKIRKSDIQLTRGDSAYITLGINGIEPSAAWANEIALQEGKEMNVDFESVEIGTVEQGKIDRRYFAHVRPTPEEVTEEA